MKLKGLGPLGRKRNHITELALNLIDIFLLVKAPNIDCSRRENI